MAVTNTDLLAAIQGLTAAVEALAKPVVVASEPVAKTTPARTRKASTRKPAAKVTKGAQTRESLSRKDWNRTLTAKAKLAGKYDDGTSVYAYVIANWDEVQGQREAGMTPDEVLAQY